ncbi:MAG: TRAP transporter substrate-binding protein [Burkholderiales bacterium]|nr:TRAP transporter substrate-binding protein [Burkholderiales bacterium]
MATIRARQFHNQPAASHIHPYLVALWDQVRRDTGGALDVEVFPQNAGIPGSDPQALAMLASGELEFFTLMGGILGQVAPEAELQGVAFAFDTPAQVFAAMDGELGAFLDACTRPHGIHMLPGGCFENGFRWMFGIDRPILAPSDLHGLRMRIPSGQTFEDLFRALGATPVVVHIRGLHEALASRAVDAHENAPVVTEVNRLHEVSFHASLTDHQWSGFNLLVNLAFWNRLSDAMRDAVRRAVATQAVAQRAYADACNRDLAARFPALGMAVHRVDREPFRAALADAGFFRDWKARLGPPAWTRLVAAAGGLARY